MRLLAGVPLDGDESNEATADWSQLVAGDWLRDALTAMRQPSGIDALQPGADLHATLRPYQADGVRWLWFMTRLGLGACLADDMGLGKTIQVIDLLLQMKRETLRRRFTRVFRTNTEQRIADKPAGRAHIPGGQLERGTRAIRVVATGLLCTPLGMRWRGIGPRGERASKDARRHRSGDHDLQPRASQRLASRHVVAARRAGRSPGDQECVVESGQGGQAVGWRRPHRAHRHARGESLGRLVVDLRLLLPGAAGHGGAIQTVRQAAESRARRGGVRRVAATRAALYFAAHEDRPKRRSRPSREDGNARGMWVVEEASGAVRASGGRVGPAAERCRGHRATRLGALGTDATETDLQPSGAIPEPGRLLSPQQRQIRSPGVPLRTDRPAARKGARIHPVSIALPAARGFLSRHFRPVGTGSLRQDAGSQAGGARPPVSARRGTAVFCDLAQGGRQRAEPDRRHRTSSTSTAGGIRRSRIRPPIGRSASARNAISSSTSSCAEERSKNGSTK